MLRLAVVLIRQVFAALAVTTTSVQCRVTPIQPRVEPKADMIERWEYLLLWYRYMTNAVSKASDEPYEFTVSYVVHRPDGTVEEHPGSATVEGLLNQFGAKGWELVAETVWDSVIVGVNGWPEAGTPANAKWTFKRRSTDKPEPDRPEPSDLQRYMEERKR